MKMLSLQLALMKEGSPKKKRCEKKELAK